MCSLLAWARDHADSLANISQRNLRVPASAEYKAYVYDKDTGAPAVRSIARGLGLIVQYFVGYGAVDTAYLIAKPNVGGIKDWSMQLTRPASDTPYDSDLTLLRRLLAVNERELS